MFVFSLKTKKKDNQKTVINQPPGLKSGDPTKADVQQPGGSGDRRDLFRRFLQHAVPAFWWKLFLAGLQETPGVEARRFRLRPN